jgi:predicted S18 family serine protease
MSTCVAVRPDTEIGGREDLEFRALARAAEAGLDGTTRTPDLRPSARRHQPGAARLFAIVIAILAIPAVAIPLRMSLASTEPVGRDGIWDAAAFVKSDARPSQGRFLVTTVKKAPGAKTDPAAAMRQSQRDAVAAALACTGARTAGDIRLRSRGVNGPSAGLIFGLTVVDHLVPTDLTGGRRIAGTGKLTATGRVDPVGAVAQKAAAAQRADADFFFVPVKQIAEAKRAASKLEVVGVRRLDDALRTLVGAGCRG